MDPERARAEMVASLAAERDLSDRVLDALEAVPRHAFVPDATIGEAYRDRPLKIGDGQTISAPHMVGIMADLLDLSTGERVLEVGTGCGYHAAVTAELVGSGNVYSVEYSADLASEARDRLAAAGYGDVSVRVGDGREGWPEHAPYDAAYLTCAASAVPDPVVGQVAVGGRILAPVGAGRQELRHGNKGEGGVSWTHEGYVRFVSMRGDQPRD